MAAVADQQGQEPFMDRRSEHCPRRVAGSKNEQLVRGGTKKASIPRFKQSTSAWKGKLEDKGPAKKAPERPWAASIARPLPWGGPVAQAPKEVIARRGDNKAWAPSTSASRAEALRKYAEAPGGDTSTAIWTGRETKGGQLDKVGRQGRVSRPDTPDDEQEHHLPRFKRTTSAWKGKLDGKGNRKKDPERPWAASIARPLPWGGPIAAPPQEVIARRSDNKAWAPSTSAARAEALRKEALCPGGDTSTPIWTGKMEPGDHCASVTTPEIAETEEEEEDESNLPAFKRKTTAWKGKLDGKGHRKKVEQSWAASVARPLPWGGAVSPLPPGAAARRADTRAWAPSTSAARAEALRKHAEAPGGDTCTPVWTGRTILDGRSSSAGTSETPEEGEDESHLPAFKRKTAAWKGKLDGKGHRAKNVERPWAQSVARPLPWGGPVAPAPQEAIARRRDNKAWAPSTSATRAEALRKHAEAPGGDTSTAIWTGKVDKGKQMGKEGRSSRVSTPETPDEAQEDEEGHLPRFKQTTTAWKGKLDGKRQTPEPPAQPWAASVARPLPWGGAVAPLPRNPAAGRAHNQAWAPSTSVARADELRKELKYLDVIQQQRRRRSADVTPTPPTPPDTPPLASPCDTAAAAAVRTTSGTVPVKPEEGEQPARDLQEDAVHGDAQLACKESESPFAQEVGAEMAREVEVREFPVQADGDDDLDQDQELCRSSDVARVEELVGMVCGDAEGEKALFLGKASYAGVLAAAEELVAEAQEVVSAAEKDVADVAVICEGAREELGVGAVGDEELGEEGEAGLVAVGEQDAVRICEEGFGVEDEEVVLMENDDGKEAAAAAAQSHVEMLEAVVDAQVQEAVAPVGGEDGIQTPAQGQEALSADGKEMAPGTNCTSASRLPKPPTAQGKPIENQYKGREVPSVGVSIVMPVAGDIAVAEHVKSDAVQMCEGAPDMEGGRSTADKLDAVAVEAGAQVEGSKKVAEVQTADEEGQSVACASDVPEEENADSAAEIQLPVETPDALAIEATSDGVDAIQVQEDLAEDVLQKDHVFEEASQAPTAEWNDAAVEAANVPVKKMNISSMWEAKQAEAQQEQPVPSSWKPPMSMLGVKQAGGQQEERKDELSTTNSKPPVDKSEPEDAEDGKLDVKMMCKLFARMSENN